jgi:cysteine-rich repeat protein
MRWATSSIEFGFAFALAIVLGCNSPTFPAGDGAVVDASGTCGDGVVDAAESCDDGDLFGNDGCSPTCTIESSDLTVTIEQASTQIDPTSARPIELTVEFSRAVVGFSGSAVSFAGSTAPGALLASVGGSGASYVVFVSGMTGSGNVVASIPEGAVVDDAETPNLASTSVDATVAFTSTTPTATIDQAVSQGDPTVGSPIAFDVEFSQPVTGFHGSDVSFTGTTVPGPLAASASGSGTDYVVHVTGMSGSGSVVVSIPAAAAANVGGLGSAASTSSDNTVAFEAPVPSVTIDQAPSQVDPTNAGPIVFAVSFNQPVTGFTASDIDFTGSTVGGTLAASLGGSGPDYTVSVTGMTTTGNVVVSIPEGAATNFAGTPTLASSSMDSAVAFSP